MRLTPGSRLASCISGEAMPEVINVRAQGSCVKKLSRNWDSYQQPLGHYANALTTQLDALGGREEMYKTLNIFAAI